MSYNIKWFYIVLIGIMLQNNAYAESVTSEEKILVQSIIPNTKIKDIYKTPVDGLYSAVLLKNKIVYVYPYKKLIFFGEILNSRGENISTEILRKIMLTSNEAGTKKDKSPLVYLNNSVALQDDLIKTAIPVINNKGSQLYNIYLFSDPDCPWCRKLEDFLDTTNSEIHYIFVPSEELHPNARAKVYTLLEKPDRIKGILKKIREDKKIPKYKIKNIDILNKMRLIAQALHVQGTPNLFIQDKKSGQFIQFIRGADFAKLKPYIEVNHDEK